MYIVSSLKKDKPYAYSKIKMISKPCANSTVDTVILRGRQLSQRKNTEGQSANKTEMAKDNVKRI